MKPHSRSLVVASPVLGTVWQLYSHNVNAVQRSAATIPYSYIVLNSALLYDATICWRVAV
jgi:hypothetical protein